jgi:transposase InsO family protein
MPLSLPSTPTSSATLAREDWLPLSVAAPMMGMHEDHASRKCREEWSPRGNARKEGGAWQVRVAAFPRLIRLAVERTEKGSSTVIERLRNAPADKRIEAGRKVDAVARFRRWREQPGIRVSAHLPAFLQVLAKDVGLARISRSRLFAWNDLCGDTERDREGCIAALLDTRGRPRAETSGGGVAESVGQAAWDLFVSLYLDSRQPPLAKCFRTVRDVARFEHAGDPAWSWPTSMRRIHELAAKRIDPETLCYAREGEAAWKARFKTPLDQHPDAFAAGECWESDHTPLDIFARVRRAATPEDGAMWRQCRPQVTMWRDRRTRRIMGWHIAPAGDSGTIRAALLHALRDPDVSVPRIAWIDNGKDFEAAAIGGRTKAQRRKGETSPDDYARGVLVQLGIEAHFSVKHNPNGKARIERGFGFMHTDFCRDFATWCGSRPGQRDREALKAATSELMALPTIDELDAQLGEWVAYCNARTDHSIQDLDDAEVGRRLSSDEYYARHAVKRRLVDRDALRLLEQVFDRPRRVHKTGIGVVVGGRTVRYGAGARGLVPQLQPLVGSKVAVFVSYDPNDVRQISVWDHQFRLICIAPQNELCGGITGGAHAVTRADMKAAHDMQRTARKRVKAKVDIASLALTAPEHAHRIARERAVAETRERVRRDPDITGAGAANHDAPLALVRTPLDGQAKAVEAAELRQAVGAEFDAQDDGFGAGGFSLTDLEFDDDADDGDTDTDGDGSFLAELGCGDDGDDAYAPLSILGGLDA